MSDQETSFLPEEESICRSMHHLSTVSDNHHHSATPDAYTSAKRHSSIFQSQLQEPMSKRPTLHPPSPPSASAAAVDKEIFGFTKLSLPKSFPSVSPPLLRRTLSEPIHSPVNVISEAPPPQSSEFPTSPAPIMIRPGFSNGNVSQESFPIAETSPAPAPPLYRTLSDPNPFLNRHLVADAGTPPRPPAPARRNPSRSLSCGESPSAKRLKRMKDRLREMSQWWTQVAAEDDDDDENENVEESENHCIDNNPKEVSGNVEEKPSQEAVFVEKTGECLTLHFKCPCGDGYQILLSGNDCYYKLTNFRN